MSHRISFDVLLLFLLVAFIGCGGAVGPKATGKVTWEDGTPVTEGEVAFEGDKNAYYGTIKPDGSYSMGALKDGQGVPPGTYKVAICVGETQLRAKSGKMLFDPKFNSSATSGLTLEVKSGQDNKLDIKLPKNPTLTPADDIAPPVAVGN